MPVKKLRKFGTVNAHLSYQETSKNRALRKLRQLDAAIILEDLRNLPGNRLEILKGDREGQYSVRIQKQ